MCGSFLLSFHHYIQIHYTLFTINLSFTSVFVRRILIVLLLIFVLNSSIDICYFHMWTCFCQWIAAAMDLLIRILNRNDYLERLSLQTKYKYLLDSHFMNENVHYLSISFFLQLNAVVNSYGFISTGNLNEMHFNINDLAGKCKLWKQQINIFFFFRELS